MAQDKPTYAETVEQVEQHLTDARAAIKALFFDGNITPQERDALTGVFYKITDIAHDVIDIKHINPR